MGWIIDLSERSGDIRRFEEGLKMARQGVMEACDIWKDMKEQFSERSDYGERYGHRMDRYGERGMYHRDEWDDMSDRHRDSRGRFM